MSFLDRLRPQPKWKHADPGVRAAAVAEMPDDAEHQTVLAELAGSDAEIRVRRAAIGRLRSVAELVALVRKESDEGLRSELSERLVAIATSNAETDGEASLALDGLTEAKQLGEVARSSPHDLIRTAALGRIHDPRTLSSVARKAADPQIALEATNRVAEPPELVNIATKTEHKDAGIAALERAAQAAAAEGNLRELLENISTRAKSKAVAKRARTMIQELEEAEAARRAALEAWQQRVAAVMARVEAMAAAPATHDAAARLDDAERDWRELGSTGTYEIDHDAVARFGALLSEGRAAVGSSRARAGRTARGGRTSGRYPHGTAVPLRARRGPSRRGCGRPGGARARRMGRTPWSRRTGNRRRGAAGAIRAGLPHGDRTPGESA